MNSNTTAIIQRRLINTTSKLRPTKEIGSYTYSRGPDVGRKVFNKGWNHLEPRKPFNLQERWHRAAVERLFHPSIIENVGIRQLGKLHTFDYRLHFETTSFEFTGKKEETDEYKKLSPWHDVPMGFEDTNTQSLLFNFVNEIPQGDRAKMECATEEEWNPIKQDTKKGELRFFKYGDLPFNYGFIPQTWEDPNESSKYSDVSGLGGDNDPVDVVEVSGAPIERGQIIPMKVLGILGLIDEGETDWKVIGIRADHPIAPTVSTVSEADSALGTNYSEIVRDWFENYKVPDGKPTNSFTHNGDYQSPEMALEVIEETHRQWYNLQLGAVDKGKLDLLSVTHKHLLAQGLTSSASIGELPVIDYPRYENWQAVPVRKLEEVDTAYEEYEMDEEAPDQRRR